MPSLPRGVALSAALHAAAALALWGWFHASLPPSVEAELDMSLASLMPVVANPGGGRSARPAETWTAPEKGQAPPPRKEAAAAPPPSDAEGAPERPCLANCAANGGGGGTGQGHGTYIPASQAARKPRWIERFIGPEDYPRVAREAGKDGRVVLRLLLDETGRVRDASLIQGAYEALNEVVLRKIREAVFTPAYDGQGRAVPCEVTLPIRFELR